ncbi:hypothetical protein E2C01_033135 [Portunus trituberculatus]|uniref:Uncharacterized protein n=1 Tax=Portunus trituberculatus TaxID=210409 RepID=A0A5B7F3E2_PORTR|nr:hypothetical protein [Portunus trituberculatus]
MQRLSVSAMISTTALSSEERCTVTLVTSGTLQLTIAGLSRYSITHPSREDGHLGGLCVIPGSGLGPRLTH